MTGKRISGHTVNTEFVHAGNDPGSTGPAWLMFHGGLEAGRRRAQAHPRRDEDDHARR